jgi:hypothetical protein
MQRISAPEGLDVALQQISGIGDFCPNLANALLFPLAPRMPVSGHDLDLERRRLITKPSR